VTGKGQTSGRTPERRSQSGAAATGVRDKYANIPECRLHQAHDASNTFTVAAHRARRARRLKQFQRRSSWDSPDRHSPTYK
jgi:hypothetical protein